MSRILNLTQHPASPEQKAAGVYDLEGHMLKVLKETLTFENLPSDGEILDAVGWLSGAALEEGVTEVMIGGAGWLMPALEKDLIESGITPLHAFSKRESVESVNPDGSVTKTNVFRHVGFVKTPRLG